MDNYISTEELAELLVDTGHHHHAAYQATDGADPEWAMWYAPYLQAQLGDRLGRLPTRGELVYLLISAEKAFQDGDSQDQGWPKFYARFILQYYSAEE